VGRGRGKRVLLWARAPQRDKERKGPSIKHEGIRKQGKLCFDRRRRTGWFCQAPGILQGTENSAKKQGTRFVVRAQPEKGTGRE